MKRSEINSLIGEAKSLFNAVGFKLPPFAFWSPEDWKRKGREADEIRANALGWDVTDFGSGDFPRTGLLLFTIRNGNYSRPEQFPKPYAEKIMVVDVDRITPMHFHWRKVEDIINRGGGKLMIQLYNSTQDDGLANTDVTVSLDGVQRVVKAGDTVVLTATGDRAFCSGGNTKEYAEYYTRRPKEYADYLSLFSGEAASVADRPALIVYYNP